MYTKGANIKIPTFDMTRPQALSGLFVQLYGQERFGDDRKGNLAGCIVVEGLSKNACGNCIVSSGAANCTIAGKLCTIFGMGGPAKKKAKIAGLDLRGIPKRYLLQICDALSEYIESRNVVTAQAVSLRRMQGMAFLLPRQGTSLGRNGNTAYNLNRSKNMNETVLLTLFSATDRINPSLPNKLQAAGQVVMCMYEYECPFPERETIGPPKALRLVRHGVASRQETETSAFTPLKPSRSMMAINPFQEIPVEVLLRISFYLTTTDLNSLRLTCRDIESSLFPTYAREFFSKKQFMLTEESLQALVDISNSRLAHHLKHVIIGLDRYLDVRCNSPVQQTIFREGFQAQQSLIWTGQAAHMLTEAFRNLKPTTVGLRDYHSSARSGRDGGHASWASYGATTVQDQTGVNLVSDGRWHFGTERESTLYWASNVFSLVLSSLGAAGARPEAIEILRRRQSGALRPLAFHVPPYLYPTVVPVLRNLGSLFLALDLGIPDAKSSHYVPVSGGAAASSTNDPSHGVDGGAFPVMERCPDFPLRAFLHHLSNLKHLRINFLTPVADMSVHVAFLSWLGSPAPTSDPQPSARPKALIDPTTNLPRAIDPASLPKLELLDLGHMVVYPKVIVQLLRKFAPTLKSLELWNVTLQQPGPESHSSIDDSGPPNLWVQLLKKMRTLPLQLEHLMIGQPMQDSRGLSSRIVTFRSLTAGVDNARMVGGNRRAYTGIDWRRFAEELESDLQIRVSTQSSSPSASDTTDEEDAVMDL
ncbi:hypothetical protein ACRALDRAFT_1094294 [Sodiomyces alcalophilus JCM 7366]|uniref:uncharacterized protein n=1 Tax=Sodiomyces alcalophilus JCM 7366 TaxID=591952 RepID=UPI0039B5F898